MIDESNEKVIPLDGLRGALCGAKKYQASIVRFWLEQIRCRPETEFNAWRPSEPWRGVLEFLTREIDLCEPKRRAVEVNSKLLHTVSGLRCIEQWTTTNHKET